MKTITDDYRLTDVKENSDILSGLNASLYRVAGKHKSRNSALTDLIRSAEQIHAESKKWKDVSDNRLRGALTELRTVFRRQKKGYTDKLKEALSAVSEAPFRTLGFRPFVVQLAGALALYKGYIIEMGTGEGKTLTAALTSVLRGWSGFPCHVITVNDYLANRDAQKLSPFYSYCGVSAGSVTSTMKPPERRSGYAKDITYSTAKEVTADFLRDRLALSSLQKFELRQISLLFGSKSMDLYSNVVTRGIHTAIIDEADSILIDEAVTPLIISKKQSNDYFIKACIAASKVASKLKCDIHYHADFQYKEIELLDSEDIHQACSAKEIPIQFSSEGFQRELIRQALTAKEFFHLNKQYVIQDGKILIVDEFTGRTMEQRTWSEGLHQMVEAKEGLEITPPNETLARLSFQRFFRLYHNLAGMTGTGKEAGAEFWHIYGLPVIAIPPNRPSKRLILPKKFFVDQKSKWDAIMEEIRQMNSIGRPVLVGTRNVETSEYLASRLRKEGSFCRLINAVHHKEEAAIVAEAGKRGAITVATNMAGRGTDIKLDTDVEALGGLHVIAAECNESSRIDRQLYGRCARQGDRGSARSYVCMDDELLRRFLQPKLLTLLTAMVKTKGSASAWLVDKAIRQAQNTAQHRAFNSRKAIQKMDTWLKDSLSFSAEGF